MGLKGDSRAGSRRGSMIPRSRGGSIQLGGAERRGSYYEEGVTQRATVAMVTDDPEHKKNVKAGLAGAFDDAAISKYNIDLLLSCTKALLQAASFVIQCFKANVASENGSAQSNGVMSNGELAGTVLDIPQDSVLR